MAGMTRESSSTFSKERVREIYLEGLKIKRSNSETPHFAPRRLDVEHTVDLFRIYSPDQRKNRAQQWSKSYYHATQDPERYLSQLDETVSTLVQCFYDDSLDKDAVITDVCDLLLRLPATPHLPQSLSVDIAHQALHPKYFQQTQSLRTVLDHNTWHDLLVTNWIDTNTVRIALTMVQLEHKSGFRGFQAGLKINHGHGFNNGSRFKVYVDVLAEILEASFGLPPSGEDAADQRSWNLARSFLWTCWYRSLMLHHHYVLRRQLIAGYTADINQYLDMRKPLSNVSASTRSPFTVAPVEYQCPWAFKQLTSERACFSQDFRGFQKRYSAVHGQKPGRCIPKISRACTGQGPKHCQRFTGAEISDQSAHDFSCDQSCNSLIWDEDSYRNVVGAKAVSIEESDEDHIRYCQASSRTIAVSHVWAHGAGGRPHTGFNACLHKRLVRIANDNNCDSYWMDTPCIPDNHELRAEAISNINRIFTMSSMTLIWDYDLMSIDLSDADDSIETKESLLCTLLVCDWNVRSWTLLESMRARHNMHILCKNNRIVSFAECLISVHNQGGLDIANLFLTNQQLLPATRPSPGGNRLAHTQRLLDGFISVEESICLLAYRHASRPDDSTVIMSLLNDVTPFYTATAFWQSKIGSMIRSGILFSSQPRLRCPGFGWAPAQPEVVTVATNAGAPNSEQYLLFDGYDTEPGWIKADGLDAQFAAFDVPLLPWIDRFATDLGESARKVLGLGCSRSASQNPLHRIRELFKLHGYRYGLLLLPFRSNGPSPRDPNYHLYYGQSKGIIFAVVGSNDEKDARWHWLGTVEWETTDPWPQLRSEKERIFLV